MVTITFSGDADEVLYELQHFVYMNKLEEKPLTPLESALKPSLETKVKEELKKHEEKPKTLAIFQKEAKKVETKKAPKEEPKKVEEVPKKEEPKKEAPKKVEEAPKPEAPKEEAPKEEPKQDNAPMTEEQMAELRTLCMNYCKKVPDGKERIKQLLKGKGCARVTDLKQKDIPEFKALVQI